ncbi:MAG: hypothetical protein JF590_06395 [Gemmatimonadetes bacterium]|nr:hypothetical protein [Gemmatimonadota bacterium]
MGILDMQRASPPLQDAPLARHLGDLTRNDARWGVYLETRNEGDRWAGRLHFVDGVSHRSTGWIFVEWTERELIGRFTEFSAVELWRVVESLQ